MAGDALQVEAVEAPVQTASPPEGAAASGSATIYWWQLTLLAARAGALERELERERRERQRVLDRYEQVLAEREEEIERLRSEQGSDRGGLRSLLSP